MTPEELAQRTLRANATTYVAVGTVEALGAAAVGLLGFAKVEVAAPAWDARQQRAAPDGQTDHQR